MPAWICVNATAPAATTSMPAITIQRAAILSARRPLSAMVMMAPAPMGAIMRPAATGLSPRTTWK